LLGKPLIAYTIEAAKESRILDRIIVSTDHDRIAEISRQYGAEVPFKRPAAISEDVPTELVLQHAIYYLEQQEKYKVGIVVTLQPTSPLRRAEDIVACVTKQLETNADSVITVCEVREYPWWMYRFEGEKLVSFMGIDLKGDWGVRQALPKVFIPNGAVYCTKRDVIMVENRIIGRDCRAIIMPRSRSLDLDIELDFIIMEKVMEWLEQTRRLR
jgi:CMP-N-acetylneuraminic acid synthetase